MLTFLGMRSKHLDTQRWVHISTVSNQLGFTKDIVKKLGYKKFSKFLVAIPGVQIKGTSLCRIGTGPKTIPEDKHAKRRTSKVVHFEGDKWGFNANRVSKQPFGWCVTELIAGGQAIKGGITLNDIVTHLGEDRISETNSQRLLALASEGGDQTVTFNLVDQINRFEDSPLGFMPSRICNNLSRVLASGAIGVALPTANTSSAATTSPQQLLETCGPLQTGGPTQEALGPDLEVAG